MASTDQTLKITVRLPWWWKLALHLWSEWFWFRRLIGLRPDEDREAKWFGDLIVRHTRFEPQ